MAPSKAMHSYDDYDKPTVRVSPMEKCGFMCHLFSYPIGLVYILWVCVPSEDLTEWNATMYFPPKQWAIHFPVSVALLFFAIPILYAATNTLLVPKLESTDVIQDQYTRRQSSEQQGNSSSVQHCVSPGASLPEICDLDPSTLIWYYHSRHQVGTGG